VRRLVVVIDKNLLYFSERHQDRENFQLILDTIENDLRSPSSGVLRFVKEMKTQLGVDA